MATHVAKTERIMGLEKVKADRQFTAISNIILLVEALDKHTVGDELCGLHVVIPVEKVRRHINIVKRSMTELIASSLRKNNYYSKPITDALLIMNTMKKVKKKKKDDKGI